MYSVYILRCADNTFYTGIAKNISERLLKHNAGQGAKYTRSRLPAVLVYQEDGYDRSGALKREHELRKLPRTEKQKLSATSARGLPLRGRKTRKRATATIFTKPS